MDRGKQLLPNESDKVARHRNLMHDIALKKQISVIQREGRLLERELREIAKVKATLMQIRDPLNKRIMKKESEEQDIVNMRNKAHSRFGLPRSGFNSKTNSNDHQEPSTDSVTKSNKDTVSFDRVNKRTNNANTLLVKTVKWANISPRSTGGTIASRPQKYLDTSASRNYRSSSRSDRTNDNNDCTLPPINHDSPSTSPQPPHNSSGSEFHDDDSNYQKTASGGTRRGLATRPETSMTSNALRRSSSTSTISLKSLPATSLGHKKTPRYEQDNAEVTLTMEETLRIKGKFRQIGHSIIATALLKGLKQRGQLTTEAIHNMHKPVMVSDAPPNKKDEGVPASDEEDGDEAEEKPKPKIGLDRFRKLTHKAINVNMLIGNPKRAQSLPTPSTKTSTNQSTGTALRQEPAITDTPSKQRKLGFAGVSKAIMLSSALNKHETQKIPSNRPLMNIHTQERRLRKFGLVGIAHAAMLTRSLNNMHVRDSSDETMAMLPAKVVRFKLDVWE